MNTNNTDFCLRHLEHEIFLNTNLTNNTNLRFALLLTVNYKIREICEIRVQIKKIRVQIKKIRLIREIRVQKKIRVHINFVFT